MSDELPPFWALDKAAKAVGYTDWQGCSSNTLTDSVARRCIIAHARTIAQWEQPPVDEDGLALLRVLHVWHYGGLDEEFIRGNQAFPAALAQFKLELEARK